MASLTFAIEGPVSALITVTEVGGDLVFNVQLTSTTGTVGDLRALYFDVGNEALLGGLSVSGSDVTDTAFKANKVTTLGGDTNINGQVLHTFGAFDAGVEFGTPGIGANDIRTTQFILSHNTLDLTLDLIAQQDFGVRITSVGVEGGARNDSLKLGGEAPPAGTAPPDAVDDDFAAEEDNSVSGNVLANDTDPDTSGLTVVSVAGATVGSAFAVTSSEGRIGQLVVASNGSFTFDPLGNFDGMAVGETDTITIGYTVSDGTSSDAATLTISIAGTNDAPLITVQPGDSSGATADETDAGLTATGTLTVSDVDVSDVITASVVGVNPNGPTGGLSEAQLLSFFQVSSGPLDTSMTTSGQLTWQFDSGAQAFDFLAVGETLTLEYTVRPDDGHGPSSAGDSIVTIQITGTNDAPVITSGPGSGAVVEDGSSVAVGTMAAFDPDNDAQEFWTAQGGTGAAAADYQFSMDNFKVVKNGNLLFEDTFSDGSPPPSAPPFANGMAATYGLNGGFQEAGGRLIIDSSDADTAVSIGTTDPIISNLALLRTNIDPNDLVSGLKSDDNFRVEGVFDLIIPDSPREVYGIRLTDRLVGGPGTPPDQLGDDQIELVVRRGVDGVVRVQLRELDIVNDQVTNIGGIVLDPPPGADQILLRLTHSTSEVGVLRASFDYLDGGVVVGSQMIGPVGRIFGTETPGFTGDDENWTRAQIVAYAPAITDSTLDGVYGTLNIDQTGDWTYTLDNARVAVQNLAEGETAVETFTVQVTDEHGASDTETINITVTGSNDAPEIQSNDASRMFDEDDTLTATGDAFFSDVDLSDTHVITPSLASATLSDGGDVPADVLAAAAGALSTTLLDAATGDTDGHYQWDFALDNSFVQFLENQSLILTYNINATDNHGASDTQVVTITVTGDGFMLS